MKQKKEQAFSNLLEMKTILDELGVLFWLDGGTLLGAYRDNDFCQDDENDVDLCTLAQFKGKIPEIIKRAEERGFELYHHWNYEDKAHEIAIRRGGCKIDLFFNETYNDVYWCLLYKGDKPDAPVVIPQVYYEILSPINFKGTVFLRPAAIEKYLEYKYGDWKTPVHRRDYSCYNANNNKVVRKDFDYVKAAKS